MNNRPFHFALLAALVLIPGVQARAASKIKRTALPKPAAAKPSPEPVVVAPPAKPAAVVDTENLLAEVEKTDGDKKRFKTYLKRRLGLLKEEQKARGATLEKEAEVSRTFWAKLQEERETFENRLVAQLQDMFESLSSLEKKDRSAAMADIQRTQSNLVALFEAQQLEKTSQFLAARQARWKELITEEDADRARFVSQAAADWRADGPAAAAASAP